LLEIRPLIIQSEIKVLKFIISLSNEHLSHYPETLEEDYNIVENNIKNLSINERNIITMRVGEKKILLFLNKFANYVLGLFELNSKEIKKKIKKDYPLECEYEPYINDVVLNLVRLNSSNIK
jgi:hypothetical protein